MKFLVVYPYSEKVLRAINESVDLGLGDFILIGDKNYIIELCYQNNISTKRFVFYDIVNDFEVIDLSKELLDNGMADYVIFDQFPEIYQQKILQCKSEDDIGTIYVLDLSILRHFLFVSNNSKHQHIDFDDKKNAILQANKIMKALSIKKANIALIANSNNKIDLLETNIIKMVLKDNNNENLNIYDSFNIATLFQRDSKYNIFKNNINLLILRNYESSRIFIDTIRSLTNAKIAALLVGKYYAVDATYLSDEDNVVFSILILKKVHNQIVVSDIPKAEVI